jgi:hypothetical protein
MARVLRLICRDILWLNSHLPPAVKIIASILGIALIVGGWYFGQEWLTAPAHMKWMARNPPRLEVAAVIFGIIFLCYISWVIDRVRRSR